MFSDASNHTSIAYLGLYALLIAFGSLYSTAGFLGFEAWSLDFLFQAPPRFITRTDISTNLLVYLPLGYMLARHLGQPHRRGSAILMSTLGGMCLSLLFESLQALIPDRIASNIDVSLNVLGTLCGALLSLHHNRWRRAGTALRGWRQGWIADAPWATLGLWLLALWAIAQFSLVPFPGAGWISLHLRPLDSPPDGAKPFNPLWFSAVLLEMTALGAFTAALLKPGRYPSAMLLLFVLAFAMKLLSATILLKLRAVGGVLSLETLSAFLLAFWLLLYPRISRHRHIVAAVLLATILALRSLHSDYLVWPSASIFNIVGLAKVAASLWPYLALAVLAMAYAARRRRAGD